MQGVMSRCLPQCAMLGVLILQAACWTVTLSLFKNKDILFIYLKKQHYREGRRDKERDTFRQPAYSPNGRSRLKPGTKSFF